MSRYQYDTACPPPQAWEAVHAVRDLLRVSPLMADGNNWLASAGDIHADEEPVDKTARYVLCRQRADLAGRRVDLSGLLKVFVHVKVASEREMPNYEQWHAALHARIQRALIGAKPTLALSEVGLFFRLSREPSRSEYYADTDTRESFAEYAVTLQATII